MELRLAHLVCQFIKRSRRSIQCSSLRIIIAVLFIVLVVLQVLHFILLNEIDLTASNSGRNGWRENEIRLMYQTMLSAINTSQVMDATGEYLIVNNLVRRSATFQTGSNSSFSDVTLVSQCSVNHLYRVFDMSLAWHGPVSVTVFASEKHLPIVFDNIVKLFLCHNDIFENVSIHLVLPLASKRRHVTLQLVQKEACKNLRASLERQSAITDNYGWMGAPYPNNLLRNVAMDNAFSEYVFVVDIDMLPSTGLYEDFCKSVKSMTVSDVDRDRIVFVIPAFEIKESIETYPKDKQTLVRLWYKKLIRPFYQELCWKCQRYTNYAAWRNLTVTSSLEVAFEAKWKDPWEPFYIAPRSVARYDERFKQYGFNRISQSCELHVAGYKFMVLNNAFLLHRGFKTVRKFHASKDEEQNRNRLLFRRFKEGLKVKYPQSILRC